MNIKQTLYYIGFRLDPMSFPQPGSIVQVDSKLLNNYIMSIISAREPNFNFSFPVYNVHNKLFHQNNPNYPYTYEIPESDYVKENSLDNTKVALQVKHVNATEKDILFEIDLSQMYDFPKDIPSEKRIISVSENDIDCIDLVILDKEFELVEKLKHNEFGYYSKKFNQFKKFKKADNSQINLEFFSKFIYETGMTEYAILMMNEKVDGDENKKSSKTIYDELELDKDIFGEFMEELEHEIKEESIKSERELRSNDQEIYVDFINLVDSDMQLYMNPFAKIFKNLYISFVNSYEEIERKEMSNQLKTVVGAKMLTMLTNTSIDINC